MVDDGDSSLREGIADSKQRTSTAVYGDDEESNVGLIEKSRRSEGQDNDEDESDLEKAVVDILSCCTGNLNTNQAKILQDMQGRINEKGNLLDDIGDISDQFDDECSNKQFIKSKLSPRQWIRNLQPKVEGPISTDQPFIRALPEKEKKKRPSILLICAVGAIMLILLTLLVVIAMKKKNSKKGTGNIQYVHSKDGVGAPTADCHLVTTQKHPSPLSQCECDGKITKIFPETNKKYDQLKEAFGENYLKANETMDSCSARNQALVWLAEDGASLHSELLVQRHSLALFYIKMHGLYWELEERQKWMTPDHECTWFGVACNDNMEVVAVELWNVNLDGSIPKELMSLTSLERLSLPENKIHGHLPDEMFRFMNKLTDLTLFMNSLSGNISPGIFEYVANLKLLNLDSNDLTGEIPTEVGLLSKLESLKIARNYIQGTIPTEIGNLKSLKRIELEENNIDGTIPSEIGKLYILEALDLSWNSLQGVSIPWEFQGLRNLKDLFLKSNQLEGKLPDIMDVWGNLENMVVSLNSFTGTLPSGLHHMTSLETLHLDGNKFNGTIPPELGSLSELRDLRLDYNDFHGVVPAEIGKLEWLVSMSLEGNHLTGTMPSAVCKLRGELGTLQTLSATCMSAPEENGQSTEVFKQHKDLVCAVPTCCTSCA